MADSIISVLFEIAADPSKAADVLKRFEAETGKAFEKARGAVSPLNDTLLSSRESVRLLSEEMGIHLPRAVSGAVAELLPTIATMGTALLGVFAVEQVSKWAVAAADKLREVYTQVDQSIKDLDSAASLAFKHASEQAAKMFTGFATSLAGTFKIEEIDARAAQLERYHDAYKLLMDRAGGDLRILGTISSNAVGVIAHAAGEGITSLDSVEKKINETGQLRFQAQERLAEASAKEFDAEAGRIDQEMELGDRLARQKSEALKKSIEQLDLQNAHALEWRNQQIAILDEVQKKREELNKQIVDFWFKAQIGVYREQNKAEKDLEESAVRGARERLRAMKILSERRREEFTLEHTELKLLTDDAYNRVVPAFQAAAASMENLRVVGLNALASLEQGMASNIEQAVVYGHSIGAAMLSVAKSIIASIGAEAIVQAIKNVALGFHFHALFAATLDPRYEAAAHLAFSSAAQWALIGGAATAGGALLSAVGGGGGAAGAYGPGAREVRGPGERLDQAGGGASTVRFGGGAPAGQTIIFNLAGATVISKETLRDVLEAAGDLIKGGDVVFPSTYTTRPPNRLA